MTTEQKAVAYRHLHEDGYEYYDAPTGSDCSECEPLYAAAELRRLHAVNQMLLERVRDAVHALDALTDRIDGTGFSESDEFNRALDEIDLGRAAIKKAEGQA